MHNQLKIWSANTGITMRDATVHLYELILSGKIPEEDIKKLIIPDELFLLRL